MSELVAGRRRALPWPTSVISRFGWMDLVVLAGAGGLIALLVRGSAQWTGPYRSSLVISLSPLALPGYVGQSLMRMVLAYLLCLAFTLAYGSLAASSRAAERVLIPILDILQSIPILSFMPGVVLAMVALLPGRDLGVELASVVLIFTSMVWNLTYSYYNSLRTVPNDLVEASRMYRLTRWLRFERRDLPFAMIGLVWNSMVSWAGGWFFLMAAETFTLGNKDFRLPGLGSYLQAAANVGDVAAIARGLLALVAVIVGLDQLLWRPMIAWSDRFKVELSSSEPPRSWFLDLLNGSELLRAAASGFGRLRADLADARLRRRGPRPAGTGPAHPARGAAGRIAGVAVLAAVAAAALFGAYQAAGLLSSVGWRSAGPIVGDFFLTLLRVTAALAIATAWTVPAGVAIGLNPRLSRLLQPVVQVVASIPATAVFPILVAALLSLRGGLNLAAILLMLLGTQWYVLFNVIAGASAIPTDLREAATVLRLRGWRWWRRLVLPAIFPFLLTGLLTATGGAWNASIVSEYVKFQGQTFRIEGLGATITAAAADGSYGVLLAGTATMALGVALINRLVWKRLYALAENRFQLD